MVAPSSSDATPSLRSSGGMSVFPLKGSPSGSISIHASSFHDVVKKNAFPSSGLVQEVLNPSIPMRKDAISKLARLSATTLICHFNGIWPSLVHLHAWISRSWLPVLKGVGLLIFQLLIFPSLANFTGAILITRMAAMLTIPVLTSYTFISKLSGVSLWLVINCASLFKNILSVTTYTGTFLLLNNSVSQDQRGAANGIAMTGASLFKALGPAGGGSIFAWAQKHRDASFLPGNQMVFFILNAVVVVVIAMTFEPFLPRSTDRPN